MAEKEIEDLKKLLDASPPLRHEEGDYAEFVHENDTTGPVQVCDKSGHVKLIMPLELWDELRSRGKE